MLTTRYSLAPDELTITLHAPGLHQPGHAAFVALNIDPGDGCAVVPFGKHAEGSTVFLPFRADRLFWARSTGTGLEPLSRVWRQTLWGPHESSPAEVRWEMGSDVIELTVPMIALGGAPSLRVAAYAKEMSADDGWGHVLQSPDAGVQAGTGDRLVTRFMQVDFGTGSVTADLRLGPERIRIYQLLPRLFGNCNETRRQNGTIAENGCGKFGDINSAALRSIREMGFTHVWLTGVMRQASATDYSAIGQPSDDPDLLKGLAGSPYAVRDCFDVSPDYAEIPRNRLNEFRDLIARVRSHGMKTLIDFVPNHVARSYGSTIRPEWSFGASDDSTCFFDPQNNFYYLRPEDHGHGPPLRLPTIRDGAPVSPTCQVLGTCDGLFQGESRMGRVTGNNVISWAPELGDWYETVKLNYGYDFTTGARLYPHGEQSHHPIPETWLQMDRILAYWQDLGVDGFRCDMAHMVPPEFWAWAIGRARLRDPGVFFAAEAYDNDPAKVFGGNPLLAALNGGRGHVMIDLLSAGFDAVYDDPSYKALKSIYDGAGWANDLDSVQPHPYIAQNSLRYGENHDEVRMAGRNHWGNIGPLVGRPVCAILYGIGRGPVMLYHGQEVGEPADGAEGFGGDDARTTIFDYWSMPSFTAWVNGHRYDGALLSTAAKELRAFYGRLLRLVGGPAFLEGEFHALNPANLHNPQFGRLAGEEASGHWCYAFLRTCKSQKFLVISNLHASCVLRHVRVLIPDHVCENAGIHGEMLRFTERLGDVPWTIQASRTGLGAEGLLILEIPPLTSLYLEIGKASDTETR